MGKNEEQKVRVKPNTEGIVRIMDLEECIDIANKLDEIVFGAVLEYVTNSVEGGYLSDEDYREYLKTSRFELLKAIYQRGDI